MNRCFKQFRIGQLILSAFLFFFLPINAQDVQLWLDGFAYRQFGKFWEYEANLGYNKLLVSNGWSDYYFNNTFTYQKRPRLAFEGSLELHYTYDPALVNVIEVRPWVAAKLIAPRLVRPINLDKPYLYARLEQRFSWYPSQDTTDQKTRLRLRGGGRFLLNKKTMTDHTVYIPWYIEGFVNFNGEAFERFALKSRVLVGVGYIFNQRFRGEFIHITQRSRNTVEDEFTASDYIFWLLVKYYIF